MKDVLPFGRRRDVPVALACALAGTALLFALVLAGCSGQASGETASTGTVTGAGLVDTVTVGGTATVTSPPDEAVIVLTVENDGSAPEAAMNATSVQSNQVLAKLKSLGIEESAIQTSSVTLYPVRTYDPNTGKETLVGYRAQNTVRVTLKDAEGVAKVLAAGVETGVSLVSGPEWRLRDDSQAINEALKQAVAHARTKAETLAAAAGASLGDVLSVSESSVQIPVPIYRYGAGATADSAQVLEPAISSGTLDVTAAVNITYSLKR
jgi:uncharacterized protein